MSHSIAGIPNSSFFSRYLGAVGGGSFATVALVLAMDGLIAEPEGLVAGESVSSIVFNDRAIEPEEIKPVTPLPSVHSQPPVIDVQPGAPISIPKPDIAFRPGSIIGVASPGSPLCAPSTCSAMDTDWLGEMSIQPRATVPPIYPPEAARLGIEGNVRVRLEVDPTGKVVRASVIESNPAGRFDSAALRAVRRWSFSADDSRAPLVSLEQVIEFALDG